MVEFTDDWLVSEAENCIFLVYFWDMLDDDDREVGEEKLTHAV